MMETIIAIVIRPPMISVFPRSLKEKISYLQDRLRFSGLDFVLFVMPRLSLTSKEIHGDNPPTACRTREKQQLRKGMICERITVLFLYFQLSF